MKHKKLRFGWNGWLVWLGGTLLFAAGSGIENLSIATNDLGTALGSLLAYTLCMVLFGIKGYQMVARRGLKQAWVGALICAFLGPIGMGLMHLAVHGKSEIEIAEKREHERREIEIAEKREREKLEARGIRTKEDLFKAA